MAVLAFLAFAQFRPVYGIFLDSSRYPTINTLPILSTAIDASLFVRTPSAVSGWPKQFLVAGSTNKEACLPLDGILLEEKLN